MIMGDFYYNFDSSSKPHSLFKQLTEALSLHQHTKCPTRVSGNILDLIFIPIEIPLFQFVFMCIRYVFLTDHYLIQDSIRLENSSSTKSLIFYRELRNLNYIELGFIILYILENMNLSYVCLNGFLLSSINTLASIKSHYFTLYPS